MLNPQSVQQFQSRSSQQARRVGGVGSISSTSAAGTSVFGQQPQLPSFGVSSIPREPPGFRQEAPGF